MATLLDYTHTEFPNHTLEVWHPNGWTMSVRSDASRPDPGGDGGDGGDGGGVDARGRDHADAHVPQTPVPGTGSDRGDVVHLPLADHTVVAHVIGADAAISLLEQMRAAGWSHTAAVLVCPAEPSVVSQGDEDRESVVDLPDRRWLLAAFAGAVVGGVASGIVGGLLAGAVLAGLIVGGFGAILGGVVGAMLGGLGRHAGERAWSQPHVPGRTMGVVATFAEDERRALEAVRVMERAEPHDVRLVNANGAWRAPGPGISPPDR